MKKFSYLLMTLLASMTLWSCGDDDGGNGGVTPDPTQREVVDVSGSITANTTWEENKKYLLKGFVYVEDGATLTIQPGTVILGDRDTKGSLIIKPGGKINAAGTAQKPIVFTSSQPKGSRNAGDWGGLIMLGRATVNKANVTIEGENTTTYGGSNDADNSGVLKYVRIEFAGIAFEANREINSLTMGGVGSGTEIDFVQVSFAGDDAYEWFGGTVNAKHLVSYRTLDDDFDSDFGYRGRVQYAYILRDPAVADAAGDSNAFESDNDAAGTNDQPQTAAQFANVTAVMGAGSGTVNPKYRSSLRIRRNSAISVYNSLFVGPFVNGLELEGDPAQNNFVNGVSNYSGLVFSGQATAVKAGPAAIARFSEESRANVASAEVTNLNINAAYNLLNGSPNALPQTGSSLLSGAASVPSGFEAAPYKGAFNNANWTEGWTNFDPNNADY